MHAAAAVGSVEVMQLLIECGLAVTAVDEVRRSVFVIVLCYHLNIVYFLLITKTAWPTRTLSD